MTGQILSVLTGRVSERIALLLVHQQVEFLLLHSCPCQDPTEVAESRRLKKMETMAM